MSLIGRHLISVAVVVVGVVALGVVFIARPTYRPSNPNTMVNMQKQPHYVVAQVRQAFASHEVRLTRAIRQGGASHGVVVLSPALQAGRAPAFTVTLFGAESMVSFGPKLDAAHGYEARFGNVAVLYGDPEPDQELLAQIEAAVSDLQG